MQTVGPRPARQSLLSSGGARAGRLRPIARRAIGWLLARARGRVCCGVPRGDGPQLSARPLRALSHAIGAGPIMRASALGEKSSGA